MPFTKEQRLKGLKKQLKNLGYTISRGGDSPPEESPAEDSSPGGDTERGAHQLAAMQAREEAW